MPFINGDRAVRRGKNDRSVFLRLQIASGIIRKSLCRTVVIHTLHTDDNLIHGDIVRLRQADTPRPGRCADRNYCDFQCTIPRTQLTGISNRPQKQTRSNDF